MPRLSIPDVLSKHHLVKRGGRWIVRRRVPAAVAHLDPRKFVKESTKVSVEADPTGTSKALSVAVVINNSVRQMWSRMIDGSETKAEAIRLCRLGVKRAQMIGLVYESSDVLATKQPFIEIVERTELLNIPTNIVVDAKADTTKAVDRLAVLGGDAEPKVMLSGLAQAYADLAEIRLENRAKTEEEYGRWFKERQTSCANLIEAIGDRDITTITEQHTNAFRAMWIDHIMEEELTSEEGARREYLQLRKMLREVSIRLELPKPVAFVEKPGFARSSGQRPAFAIDFVRDVILTDVEMKKRLDSASHDALIVIGETGARPSEIRRLKKADIVIDTNDQYIFIRAGKKKALKTKNSERKIPLRGAALEAMRRNPNGFPHLADKNAYDEVRRTINGRLRELQPNVNVDDGQNYKTLYSLRHTFKNRLRATDARDSEMDQLMGHYKGGFKYGDHEMIRLGAIMDQLAF